MLESHSLFLFGEARHHRAHVHSSFPSRDEKKCKSSSLWILAGSYSWNIPIRRTHLDGIMDEPHQAEQQPGAMYLDCKESEKDSPSIGSCRIFAGQRF